MKKEYFVWLFVFLGVGCFVVYNIIGSRVAPDGTLIEPFGLIPMGYFFIIIGIILSVVFYLQFLYRKFKK